MSEERSIKTLFVDIGGVLLSDGWGHASRELAAQEFDLDPRETEERHHQAWAAHELGQIDLERYLDLVVFHQKRPFSRACFRDFMIQQSTPFPEMIELVRSLKARFGLKVVAVSNEGRELNAHRIQAFQLDRLVDFFVSSCYVRLRKPDHDIFRLALDAAQAKSSQVAYLENTPMFIQVAEDLGIRGILHVDRESTGAKLASLGLGFGKENAHGRS